MKRAICLVFVVLALLFATELPGHAQSHGGHGGHSGHGGHGHGHSSFSGSIWIGPGWGWGPWWGGWGPWWWGAPAYPYYPYSYGEPPVMQQQPQTYVEPTPRPEEEYYWYFCPDARNYYPYVKECPSGWLRVVPHQTPPDWRE